jgi:hypothetical protein
MKSCKYILIFNNAWTPIILIKHGNEIQHVHKGLKYFYSNVRYFKTFCSFFVFDMMHENYKHILHVKHNTDTLRNSRNNVTIIYGV